MDITNCTLSTDTLYASNPGNSIMDLESSRKYILVIKIPVPGGEITYKIPSSQEVNNNIEAASKLLSAPKKR